MTLKTFVPERETPTGNLQPAVVQDDDLGPKVGASVPGGNPTTQLSDNDFLPDEHALIYGSYENYLQHSDTVAHD